MIRAVALDLGGVILSWRAHAPDLDAQLEADLGLPRGTVAGRLWNSGKLQDAECGRVTAEEFWSYACDVLAAPRGRIAAFDEALWSETQYLDERVAAWLDHLRSRCRVVAFTNAWSDARHQLERRYGLESLVDELVVSAEIGLAKPDRAAYARLIDDHLGVAAEQAAFVDDRLANVDAAAAVGMTGILCAGPDHLIESVNRLLAA